MSRVAWRRHAALAAALVVAALAAACGGPNHHLAQYSFADKTLSMVYVDPPSPELLHGIYDLKIPESIQQGAVYAGGAAAKEVAARRARARLDTAAQRYQIEERLAQRTVERASRYLGTRPVMTPQGSDFVLEVNMRKFGIDARNSEAVYMFTNAEAVLLDRHTGREIWSVRVSGRDRLTPYVEGNSTVPASIITAGTISTVSVEDMQNALDQLTTFTSRLITDELRAKLREARDR